MQLKDVSTADTSATGREEFEKQTYLYVIVQPRFHFLCSAVSHLKMPFSCFLALQSIWSKGTTV